MTKVTPHKVIGPEWTEDRVETLKKLWAEGYSASQVAVQLGGITRNSVIGKVHRLGLIRTKQCSQISNRLTNSLRANRHFNWTEERDELLTELFNAGAFDPEIASVIGATRDTVQRRRKALRLLRQAAGARKAPPIGRPQLIIAGNGTVLEKPEGQAPRASIAFAAWAPLPGVKPMLRDEAKDRHCKWPITVEGDELSWCCSAMATEGPYCAAHARKGTRPNQPDDVRRAKRKQAEELSHAKMTFWRAA